VTYIEDVFHAIRGNAGDSAALTYLKARAQECVALADNLLYQIKYNQSR